MDDIVLTLRPEIDTSNINKSMKEVADESARRMEKSFDAMSKNIKQSVSEAFTGLKTEPITEIEDTFGRIYEAAKKNIDIFSEYQRVAQSTGTLPEGVTAKLYSQAKAASELSKSFIDAYQNAVGLEEIISEERTEPYANIKRELADLASQAQSTAFVYEDLRTQMEQFARSESLIRSVSSRTGSYSRFSEYMKQIDDYIAKIKELEDAQRKFDSDTGKVIWLSGNELEQNKAQIAEYEREIQKIQNTMNLFGKSAIAAWTEAYNIQQNLTFEPTREGLIEAQEELMRLGQKFEDIAVKYELLSSEVSNIPFEQKFKPGYQTEDYTQTVQNMREMAEEMAKVKQETEETANGANRSRDEYAHLRAEIRAGERFMAQFYTVCMDVVRASKMIVNVYKKIFSVIKQVLGVIKKMRDHLKKTSDEHAKNWKQMLRDILRYSLGIRSLFALFRRLRRYIREAFEAMGSQIPEVQAMLDNLSSSLGMLKGSLATAFEPILSAIAPILDILIEKLSTALTYIGMFFAALTGRGYVYKATKAIKGVTDAAKEMNKQLQGFDELNNLTSQKDSGGGESPLANFEKVDIPDWIKNIADYIRDLFNKIMAPIKEAWRKVGDYVKAAWKRAFYAVKALLMDIIDDFVRAWTEKGEMIATRVFEIVGDIGNIIANIADSLRAAWEYNDNGYKIWCAILDIIQKVLDGIRRITIDMVRWTRTLDLTPAMTAFREWLESLVPVIDTVMYVLYDFWNHALKPILNWAFNGENSGIARFFKILKDFNDKLDLEKIRNDLDLIWQAVGRFGVSIGEGLLKFMERMLGYLAEWLNSDDFTEWCQKVADFLDNIDADEIADDLEQVYRIIKNIADWTWKAIKYFLDHKDEILDALEWMSEHISLILGAMVGGKLIIDVGRLIAEFVRLKTFFKAAGALQTIAEGGASAAGAAAGTSFLSNFMENIVGAGTALETFLTTDVATLASAGAGSLALTIGTALVGGILSFLAGSEIGIKIGEALWPEDMELYQKYEGVAGKIDLIKDSWQALVDFIDLIDLKEKMFGWLPSAEEMGENGTAIIEGLKSGMLAALETIGTAISPGLKGIIDLVKTIFLIASPSKVMEDIGMNIVQGLIDGWNNNIDKIFTAITDFGNKIIEKFNDVKSKVTTLFSNMVSAIRAILSGLASTVSSTLSTIGSKISSAVSSLKSKVNDVVSSANSKFHVNIPHLAQGAVIPPNNEFLAVLGDQKSGTNIESPLSTMVEAFNQANKGGSEAELALLQEQNDLLRQLLQKEFGITEGAIFRAVRTQNSQFMKQNGVSAFA